MYSDAEGWSVKALSWQSIQNMEVDGEMATKNWAAAPFSNEMVHNLL